MAAETQPGSHIHGNNGDRNPYALVDEHLVMPNQVQANADVDSILADKILEQGLLGAILREPAVMEHLDQLVPDDFYYADHQELFKRMGIRWDAKSGIDPTLVCDRDPRLLSICAEAQTLSASVQLAPDYARMIGDLARKRRMSSMLEQAAQLNASQAPAASVYQYLSAELDKQVARADEGWVVKSAANLVEPPAAREWLLEGLIFKGQISMWYGPPGILKTLLLMNLCACMSLGRNWLMRMSGQEDHPSLVTFHCTRAARVLWLDYDNGEFETQIRIRAALMAYDGLGRAHFDYMSETTPWLALDDPAHVRRLINLAKQHQADVIVFDALGMILGDVDENAPAVAKVISKLKEIRAATNAALICVHHPSKAGGQSDKASTYNAAGSAKFSNFFEWTVELRRGSEDGTIVAEVVKHRGWAKAKKLAARFSYSHFGPERPDLAHELESFTFYPYAVENKGEKRDEAIRDAVIAALSDGAELNQTELALAAKAEVEAATNHAVGEAAIRHIIKVMAAQGELQERPTGERRPVYYRLPGGDDPVDRS